MRVLIACEYSGRTREAFRRRGHDAWSVDLLPAEDQSPWHIIADVFDMIANTDPWDLLIAHPTCQFLANSGTRWLYKKETFRSGPDEWEQNIRVHDRWDKMRAGADFFARLYTLPIDRVAVENPIMHQHARDAISQRVNEIRGTTDFRIEDRTRFCQPWWFGDRAFKNTGFTLKGLQPLVKPATALVPPKPGTPEHKEWSIIHNAPPGPNRWKERSRTFPGIARAMAEAWG